MKQVIQDQSAGRVSVVDVPRPILGPAGVLIEVSASLISSGTERAKIEMGEKSLIGKARARPDLAKQVFAQVRRDGIADTVALVRDRLGTPQPLGYSAAGLVIETGPLARGVTVGQLVACGGAGLANHAEVVQVPWTLCAPAPTGVSAQDACFATVGSIALHGLRQARLGPGDLVIVSGLGLIGQIAVRLCTAYGHPVVGVDPSQVARDELEASGIDVASPNDPRLRDHEADAVLITAATTSSEPVSSAPTWCRDRGVVVVVGDVGLTLPRAPYYEKEVEFRFSRSYGAGRYDPQHEEGGIDYPIGYAKWTERRNIAEILRLLSEGRLVVDDLISSRYPIEDAPAAYDQLAHGARARAILLDYSTPTSVQVANSPATQERPVPTGRPALHVGFCGAGNFARKTLLPGLEETGRVSWTRIATATGTTAAHVGRRLSFQQVVGDPEEVTSDPGTDAVVIATRHDTHARLVASAAAAGKFVFVEKPLAIDRLQLETLKDLPGRAQVVTGFNRRWSPAAQSLLEPLSKRSGPLAIQARVNAGVLPDGHWAGRAEQGGRLVGELCHFIDLACFFVGLPVAAVEVIGTGRTAPLLEDTAQILLQFSDGSSAAIAYLANGGKALAKERLEIHWDYQSAVLDDFRRLTLFGAKEDRRGGRRQDKGHRRLLSEFVRYAIDGGLSPVPFHQAIHVTDVSLCVVDALCRGDVVKPDETKW